MESVCAVLPQVLATVSLPADWEELIKGRKADSNHTGLDADLDSGLASSTFQRVIPDKLLSISALVPRL